LLCAIRYVYRRLNARRVFAEAYLYALYFARRSKSKFYPQSGLNFKISRPKKHIQKENPRFVESFLKPFEFAF